jgi:hypothetical protein
MGAHLFVGRMPGVSMKGVEQTSEVSSRAFRRPNQLEIASKLLGESTFETSEVFLSGMIMMICANKRGQYTTGQEGVSNAGMAGIPQ